jgi:hypothetical protein
MTGSFINQLWQLVNVCLDFKVFEGSTTGVCIAEDVLRRHGLMADNTPTENVISIKTFGTTDTTASMIVMKREMRNTG